MPSFEVKLNRNPVYCSWVIIRFETIADSNARIGYTIAEFCNELTAIKKAKELNRAIAYAKFSISPAICID